MDYEVFMDLNQKAGEALAVLRVRTPLVHNITNFVVMNFVANTLLAAGAAPVMAHAHDEVEEMTAIAGALALNIGTLTDYWVESMLLAGQKANSLGTPVILDPVGAGATRMRTEATHTIMRAVKCAVLRGNASEIMAIYGAGAGAKGVDSVNTVDEAVNAAFELAAQTASVVAITGAMDIVTDGQCIFQIANGDPMMGRITGMGCSVTAMIAAFLAVEPAPMLAAAYGLALMGAAGEIARTASNGPGTFMAAFLDALYNLTPQTFADMARIKEL